MTQPRDPRMLTDEEEEQWRAVKREPPTREDWEDLMFTIEGYKRRRIARHLAAQQAVTEVRRP